MRPHYRRSSPVQWGLAHSVDLAFGLLALGWLLYVLRITGEFHFLADDLRLVDQGSSVGGLFEPYNGHMSLVILSIFRAAAQLGGLSYTPFMIAGALALVAVPVSYFVTTRGRFGAPLAAVLAMPLLWYDGMSLRPALLNHYLALVGGIVCAAALNRGRRADGLLVLGLTLALCSAGGGVAVAGACVVHNVLVRPPLRRWLAVLVPSALWAGWWLLVANATSPSTPYALSGAQAARVVRDLCLSPFYVAGFGNRFLAYVLMAAFLVLGAAQLRRGLDAGANFLAWSAALVGWAMALVQSRGVLADAQTFRYGYVAMGFTLLAVVPRVPIRWPEPVSLTNRRWLTVAALGVVVAGGLIGLTARSGLQKAATTGAELGREAEGTMLVLGLEEEVIPDATPILFYGFFNPHGSAQQVRELMDRYGSPFDATMATADRELVDLEIVRTRAAGNRPHPGCQPLTEPVAQPGIVTTGLGALPRGQARARVPAQPLQLWSAEPFTVDVRRYGEEWVRLVDVPGGRNVVLTLPALSTERPWEVRADGACAVRV